MGNFLDVAKQEKESESIKTLEGLAAAATGMQGWRLEMEVRKRICNFVSRYTIFFAF